MSFRFKTILGIALIETVLLSILVFYNITILKQTNESEINKRAESTIDLFTASARDAIFSTDIATLQTLANKLAEQSEIKYVVIKEPENLLLAKSGTLPTTSSEIVVEDILSSNTNIFAIAREVSEADEVYAIVKIYFDIQAFKDTLSSTTKSSFAIAIIEIILVGIFSLLLGNYLTGQLEGLRKGAKHITNGDLGYQIPVTGSDELAETAMAFNHMSLQVRKDHSIQKAIMDSAIDCIISVDEQGNITEFNDAAENLLGYKKDEVIGEYICDLIRPRTMREDDEIDFRSFVEGNTTLELGKKFETQVQTNNGDIIPVDIVINTTNDTTAAPFYIFYISDISDRKIAEKLKDEFVSTVSHELRTPLTSIQGSLKLLSSGVIEDKKEQKDLLLQTALSNSERLLQIVNDLLDIQKIESGHLEIYPEEHNLIEILNMSLNQNQAYADKFNVNIELISNNDPVIVMIDKNRLLQVMANLISNACKFSPEKSTVKILTRTENGRVKVSICDQGTGIPKEFQDKIFGKFTQANSASNRTAPGTGLGLSITKRLIEAHHGTINFQTQENIGTEFYFELPLVGSIRHDIAV